MTSDFEKALKNDMGDLLRSVNRPDDRHTEEGIEIGAKYASAWFEDNEKVYIYSKKDMQEQIAALKEDLDKLIKEMRFAMKYYKSCGDEVMPEFQLYQSFEEALASLKTKKCR